MRNNMVPLSYKIHTIYGDVDYWVERNLVHITRCIWPDWFVFPENPWEDPEDVEYYMSVIDETFTLQEIEDKYQEELNKYSKEFNGERCN